MKSTSNISDRFSKTEILNLNHAHKIKGGDDKRPPVGGTELPPPPPQPNGGFQLI